MSKKLTLEDLGLTKEEMALFDRGARKITFTGPETEAPEEVEKSASSQRTKRPKKGRLADLG